MRRWQLVCEVYTKVLSAAVARAGGLPTRNFLEECSRWSWDAADALLDACSDEPWSEPAWVATASGDAPSLPSLLQDIEAARELTRLRGRCVDCGAPANSRSGTTGAYWCGIDETCDAVAAVKARADRVKP